LQTFTSSQSDCSSIISSGRTSLPGKSRNQPVKLSWSRSSWNTVSTFYSTESCVFTGKIRISNAVSPPSINVRFRPSSLSGKK